tara:strand:+ start:418 stop:879 length:462 start_codon:yes stop_codon:yes gene_type:complete
MKWVWGLLLSFVCVPKYGIKFKNGICLVLLVLAFSCGRDGTILDTDGLTIEFEDLWWEPIGSSYLSMIEGKICLKFVTNLDVEWPADGTVLQHFEIDGQNYILSDFQRIDGGYRLLKYDVDIFVFQDSGGHYIEVNYLGLTEEVSIIPCSLVQ